ncbi:MAG: competence/damage-inducible protein A [Verrucomicrobiota bacterium]|nr:competence/damage-inducible protein A [Verrucomicrobiota bacterium]
MRVEIINTGSELMLGYVLNTHQQWLCAELARAGFLVLRQTAIDDTPAAISGAVEEAFNRADLVITTGGLGPTSDDLTREVIARLLGRSLREDPGVLEHIHAFFAKRNKSAPKSTHIQAQIPEGAEIFMNAHGTAPGLAMSHQGKLLVMLPGPPRELRPMFTTQVLPYLERVMPERSPFCCRVLKTSGMGESSVEETIAPHLRDLTERGLEIGYCARVGEVDVRLLCRSMDAMQVVVEAEGRVKQHLSRYLFSTEGEPLEQVIVQILTEQGRTVAFAESCTGGFLAHRITNIPGASHIFSAGVVTYSNPSKTELLGVPSSLLEQHGAVSAETARSMAEGARHRFKTHFAVAVTGIAGPGGGSAEKPVGTVHIAVASRQKTVAVKSFNPFDRETFKYVTSQQAFTLLRKIILE